MNRIQVAKELVKIASEMLPHEKLWKYTIEVSKDGIDDWSAYVQLVDGKKPAYQLKIGKGKYGWEAIQDLAKKLKDAGFSD